MRDLSRSEVGAVSGMDTMLGKVLHTVIIVLGVLAASWLLDGLVPPKAKIYALAVCTALIAFVTAKLVDTLLQDGSKQD